MFGSGFAVRLEVRVEHRTPNTEPNLNTNRELRTQKVEQPAKSEQL